MTQPFDFEAAVAQVAQFASDERRMVALRGVHRYAPWHNGKTAEPTYSVTIEEAFIIGTSEVYTGRGTSAWEAYRIAFEQMADYELPILRRPYTADALLESF